MTNPVDFEDLKRRLGLGEAMLIDVREIDEWDEGHIKGARLVPLSELDNDEIPGDLPEDKTLLCYCRRGGRAQRAAIILGEHYPDVQPLVVAYEDLSKQLPAE